MLAHYAYFCTRRVEENDVGSRDNAAFTRVGRGEHGYTVMRRGSPVGQVGETGEGRRKVSIGKSMIGRPLPCLTRRDRGVWSKPGMSKGRYGCTGAKTKRR